MQMRPPHWCGGPGDTAMAMDEPVPTHGSCGEAGKVFGHHLEVLMQVWGKRDTAGGAAVPREGTGGGTEDIQAPALGGNIPQEW